MNGWKKEGLDDPEDRDVYLAERVFWVSKEARWKNLQDNAKQESIGNLIDLAMEAIEQDNPNLKGMLPGNYGRATLDKRRFGDRVAAAAQDANVYFWDQAVGQWSRWPALAGSRVSCVSFSPDGQLVAAGTDDNRLLVWSVETG
jgi:WD40 repeat protein